MHRLVVWIQSVAEGIGGPGLLLVAFLDSSILSLPELADLLLIAAVMQRPELMGYYGASALVGSIAGCYVMYYLGERGGEAFLKRRFSASALDRALGAYRRFGLLALLVPAVLPPPAPFKIFVLLAGIAGVKRTHFLAAIAVGRGVRYFGEGLLGILYGQQAITLLETNGRTIAYAAAGLIVLCAVIYVIVRGRSRNASVPEV